MTFQALRVGRLPLRGRFCALSLVLSLFIFAPPALAQDAHRPAAQDGQPQSVDAATKQLTAAHGLFQRGLYKLAAAEYEGFLKDHGDHAEATTAKYALGVCRYRLNEYDAAVASLNEVLRDAKFAQRDDALAVVGHCHLAKKDYDKALAAFDELLAKHPQSKHAEVTALNRAQVLYLAGKPPEAAEAAKAFISKYPQSKELPTGLYFLALSQYGQNKPAEAGKTLADLLQAHGDSRYSLDATLLFGQCLEATGDLDGATQQYRRFVDSAPATRKGDGYYSLGVALYKAGKYDEAARELARVIEDGKKEGPYANAARLQLGLAQLAGGKTSEARQTLEQVAASDADRRNDARYGLAQCDIAEKKFDSARAALDELSKAQPAPANLPQVLLDRAVCAAELGKHDQAVEELDAFRKRFSDGPQAKEAAYRQAFSLHKLGKFDQSRALSEKLAEAKDSPFAAPAAELDAENLFLLTKYPEAAEAYAKLSAASKDDDKRLRFELRRGQCAYFAGDYAKAVQFLQPLASDEKVARSADLQQAVFLLGDAQLQQGKNAEAAEALEKFLRWAKGDNAEAQYKLALAQLRSKDPDAAERTLAQVASGPADSPWVQRALLEHGQLLYKQNKPAPAADALERVLRTGAPDELAAPATYLLGWIDFDAKRFEQADQRWSRVREKYPTHALAADAAFQRGVALKEAGKLEDALSAFQAYLASYKDGQHVPKAKQLAAATLVALDRNDQAEQMLATLASDTQSASDTVLYDLAWAQRGKKDTKAAAETYRRLLKSHPESKLAPAARAELAEFVYAAGDFAGAAALLEPVVADDKADPKTLLAARYRLGWCYEKLNKHDKAGAALLDFADQHADSDLAASALLQAGLSYAADGRADKAEGALSRMLERFPQHKQASVAMLKLGEVQAESSQFDKSLRTFSDFLARYGSDPLAYRAHFGAGWAHENLKHYEEARKAYQKTIAATNTETAARAQFQIGETHLAEGKLDDAVAALLAVEDVYAYPQWSARALVEAGRAFEQLKQNEQASAQYSIVVSKYKDTPEAGLAQERLKALKNGRASVD
jgi:TolA-binding protein